MFAADRLVPALHWHNFAVIKSILYINHPCLFICMRISTGSYIANLSNHFPMCSNFSNVGQESHQETNSYQQKEQICKIWKPYFFTLRCSSYWRCSCFSKCRQNDIKTRQMFVIRHKTVSFAVFPLALSMSFCQSYCPSFRHVFFCHECFTRFQGTWHIQRSFEINRYR